MIYSGFIFIGSYFSYFIFLLRAGRRTWKVLYLRGQCLVKLSESLLAAFQWMVDGVTSNLLLWAAPPCQRICQKAAMHNFAKYLNLFAQQIPPSGSRNSPILSSLQLSRIGYHMNNAFESYSSSCKIQQHGNHHTYRAICDM